MMRGAMTRRNDRSVDLQLDGSNVAARTEGTAQTALIDGEVRAAQAEAAGGIAGFEGRAGGKRNVCQRRATVDAEQPKSRRAPGQIGGDQACALIGAADQVVSVRDHRTGAVRAARCCDRVACEIEFRSRMIGSPGLLNPPPARRAEFVVMVTLRRSVVPSCA